MAYIPHLRRALNGDIDRRTKFIGWLVEKQAQADFMNGIVWSDEASFQFNCCINRHNIVYWCNAKLR
jgi:hypothetical protein